MEYTPAVGGTEDLPVFLTKPLMVLDVVVEMFRPSFRRLFLIAGKRGDEGKVRRWVLGLVGLVSVFFFALWCIFKINVLSRNSKNFPQLAINLQSIRFYFGETFK